MTSSPLSSLSIEEFLERLSSAEPTPGGGAAAALVGALAASLGRMVCALTVGKPKFAAAEPELRPLATRLARAVAMLRQLTEEDAAAYAELSAALRLERSDPNRRQRVAEAATVAAAVPLETTAVARQVWSDLRRLEALGNPNLRPDVLAALELARAAGRAAAENVRANLPLLPEDQAERVSRELEQLLVV